MGKAAREGDGTLKPGDPRMKIIIVTKEDDFAECTFERLDDRIELEPVDMARLKRALQKGYRSYKRKRAEEAEALAKVEKAGEEEKSEPRLGSGFVVDKGETRAEGSMEVLEPTVAVIEKKGEGYDA